MKHQKLFTNTAYFSEFIIPLIIFCLVLLDHYLIFLLKVSPNFYCQLLSSLIVLSFLEDQSDVNPIPLNPSDVISSTGPRQQSFCPELYIGHKHYHALSPFIYYFSEMSIEEYGTSNIYILPKNSRCDHTRSLSKGCNVGVCHIAMLIQDSVLKNVHCPCPFLWP